MLNRLAGLAGFTGVVRKVSVLGSAGCRDSAALVWLVHTPPPYIKKGPLLLLLIERVIISRNNAKKLERHTR